MVFKTERGLGTLLQTNPQEYSIVYYRFKKKYPSWVFVGNRKIGPILKFELTSDMVCFYSLDDLDKSMFDSYRRVWKSDLIPWTKGDLNKIIKKYLKGSLYSLKGDLTLSRSEIKDIIIVDSI